MNNIKNIWERIKSIITIKNLPMAPPSQTKQKFQISLAIILQQLQKTHKNINPSHKSFSDFLKKTDIKTQFF